MSIAKSLPPVDTFFLQECPLCGVKQRMMIRGLYIDPETKQGKLYPDMGYSFCNCRDIFFTKWENISNDRGGFNGVKDPRKCLKDAYDKAVSGQSVLFTMKDPYFCHWTRPHEYAGFDPRSNYILWDMHSFVNECLDIGFELISAIRDMNVDSPTPECFHITLRKP